MWGKYTKEDPRKYVGERNREPNRKTNCEAMWEAIWQSTSILCDSASKRVNTNAPKDTEVNAFDVLKLNNVQCSLLLLLVSFTDTDSRRLCNRFKRADKIQRKRGKKRT